MMIWKTGRPEARKAEYVVTLENGNRTILLWKNDPNLATGEDRWHWVGNTQGSRVVAYYPAPKPYDSGKCQVQRIEIPLGGDRKLVAEENIDHDYKEIFVFLEKDGVAWQDLAIIGEQYRYRHSEKDGSDVVVPVNGEYTVKVYSDSENEDYTHVFDVGEYHEDEYLSDV